MSTKPLISVLLPTYNSANTLAESIRSILEQSFRDFELLVLDDGSTDTTSQVIEGITDPRVRYIPSSSNMGLGYQLNRGVDLATGTYLARLDADDWSTPDRFERQLALLDSSTTIGICGSQAQLFDSAGAREIWNYPTDPDSTHSAIVVRSPFLHPGVMIRARLLHEHGLRYDTELKVAQDYDLWHRLLKVTQGINLPGCLTWYRISASQLTSAQAPRKDAETAVIREKILGDLGLEPDVERMTLYHQITSAQWEESETFFSAVARWMNELVIANRASRVFPTAALETMLAEIYFQRCQCAAKRGFRVQRVLQRISFIGSYCPHPVEMAKMRIKSLLKPAHTR